MSHSYRTRTFSVSQDEIPATFSSKEEFAGFAKRAGGIAHARSDSFHHLWGHTRGGWAIYTTRNLLRSLPQPSALQFLADSGHTYKFEDEYGFTGVSVLQGTALDNAAEELRRLLSALQANPMAVYDADEAGHFVGDDVEAALARTYTSRTPSTDPQVWGDEGEGADYLITYLRSVLALLDAARAERLCVVHSLEA